MDDGLTLSAFFEAWELFREAALTGLVAGALLGVLDGRGGEASHDLAYAQRVGGFWVRSVDRLLPDALAVLADHADAEALPRPSPRRCSRHGPQRCR